MASGSDTKLISLSPSYPYRFAFTWVTDFPLFEPKEDGDGV